MLSACCLVTTLFDLVSFRPATHILTRSFSLLEGLERDLRVNLGKAADVQKI